MEVSHYTLQAHYSWLVSVSHSQMKTILNISLTLPILNATGKRQFSALKRVKNYLCSTISQEHLTTSAILATESSAL